MAFPALLGYYQPPTDTRPPSVDLYHAPNGGDSFHLHEEMEALEASEQHYNLPDFGSMDNSPLEDADEINVLTEVPLENLGDIIDYYKVYALYLQTPTELYTYATVPMWPDINPLFAHAFSAALYENNPVMPNGDIDRTAVPLARFGDETFKDPLDPQSDIFNTLADTHRELIKSAKLLLEGKSGAELAESSPIVTAETRDGNYVAATVDRPDMIEDLTSDGILVRVTPDAFDTSSIAAASGKLLMETNRLRVLHSQNVWETHLDRASSEIDLTDSDDSLPDPQQTAINEAYTFTIELLEEFDTNVSPLSADLFADEIIEQTESQPTDFIGQKPPEQ